MRQQRDTRRTHALPTQKGRPTTDEASRKGDDDDDVTSYYDVRRQRRSKEVLVVFRLIPRWTDCVEEGGRFTFGFGVCLFVS